MKYRNRNQNGTHKSQKNVTQRKNNDRCGYSYGICVIIVIIELGSNINCIIELLCDDIMKKISHKVNFTVESYQVEKGS